MSSEHVLAVWPSFYFDARGYEVVGRFFDLSGNPVDDEFTVNTTTSEDQNLPVVSMNSSGASIVVWSGGVDPDIYAQLFTNQRLSGSSELLINQVTIGEQVTPRAAMAEDGSFVVSWTGIDSSLRGVYARHFNASGDPLDDEFLVNQSEGPNQKEQAMAMASDGKYAIAWVSDSQDGSGEGVFFRVFSSTGVPLTNELQVNQTTASDQTNPSIAYNNFGDIIILWDSLQGGTGDVYGRIFTDSGVPTTGEFPINETIIDQQSTPQVTSLPSGKFVATWQSNQDGGAITSYARGVNADGTFCSGEYLIGELNTENQESPSVATNELGQVGFLWNYTGTGRDLRLRITELPEEGVINIDTLTENPDKTISIIFSMLPHDPPPSLGYNISVYAIETDGDCSELPLDSFDEITDYVTGDTFIDKTGIDSGELVWDLKNMSDQTLKDKYYKANLNVSFRVVASPVNE